MKTFILIIFACFMISCNENGPVNNGSDKTAIDKSVSPSSSEQKLESTDGIRVIIPGGALNTDLGIKLVKLANPPKLSDSKTILGTNIFQLSLSGDLNFNSTIQFRVKYDKSKIQSGFTPQTGVKGMMFTNNLWSVSEYEIDVTNEEIVFFVEPTGGISCKDKEELLENSEVTFGDGYTINDSGQGDELLSKMIFYMTTLAFQGIREDDIIMDLQIDLSNLNSETTKVLWNSNKFTINQNDSNQFGYSKFNASGEINKTNWTLLNYKFQYIVYDNYSQMSTHLEEYNVQFNDINGIENNYGDTPVWLTFSAVYNGSGIQSNFKNSIKSITYKITNYKIDGNTIENEHYLKSVNWDNYVNQINFNLYQFNK